MFVGTYKVGEIHYSFLIAMNLLNPFCEVHAHVFKFQNECFNYFIYTYRFPPTKKKKNVYFLLAFVIIYGYVIIIIVL